MSNLKQYIKEVLEELEEMSVAGAIGVVATPLGTGPSGKVRYKSTKSSDKKLRSKSKKSVQHILKHGPSKKRSLKENYNFLFEGTRTPQIENVPKEHLLAFVDHMLGNATEGYDISMTEKLSGQHVSILLEGTSLGLVFSITDWSFSDGSSKCSFSLNLKSLICSIMAPFLETDALP